MDRMLVVIFDTEDKAREGARTLRELDQDGSIAVYDGAIITKSPNGVATVRPAGEFGPLGTVRGLVIGSLIGLLAGPAGLAIGFVGGTLIGAASDFENVRVGHDFLTDVATALGPGKLALVAEIDEDRTLAVDTSMEALGGHILRRSLWDLKRTENEQDVDTLKAEIAESKAEHAEAKTERKAKLQVRIDALNSKLQQKLNQAKARREDIQQRALAKVETLKAKAAQARQDIKAKHEQRIAKAVKEYHKWLDMVGDVGQTD